MSFKSFLKEKQIILANMNVKYLYNPSIEEIARFIRDNDLKSLRWSIVKGGDYYFWDGDVLHRDMQTNVDEDFVIEGSYWIKAPKMNISEDGDISTIIKMINEYNKGINHPCIKTLYTISKMFGDKSIYFQTKKII